MASDPALHPRLNEMGAAADALVEVARELVRAAARVAPTNRRRHGATVRPGSQTPMWNALVRAIRPFLRRRGEKSNLGRLLGVPPQRVHEYFVACTAMPDAERTLVALHWLSQREAGLLQPPGPQAVQRDRERRQPASTTRGAGVRG